MTQMSNHQPPVSKADQGEVDGGGNGGRDDGSRAAVGSSALAVPERLAVVMGRESDGVTAEMLAVASQRIFLPLVGFNTSLNLQASIVFVLTNHWCYPLNTVRQNSRVTDIPHVFLILITPTLPISHQHPIMQVATGMVLQQLFNLCPSARGAMSDDRRAELRRNW